MRLLIMGPPGAGKGTQGERLAEALGVPRFSTGDFLRDARQADTELGRRARGYMDAGELVPDDVILEIVGELLQERRAAAGFVLDGFPRTVAQAEGLADLLRSRDERLDALVNLEVPEAELERRLLGRASAEGRADDTKATIRRRLEVYRKSTLPVLQWYRESGVPVLDVAGVGDIEVIQATIRAELVR